MTRMLDGSSRDEKDVVASVALLAFTAVVEASRRGPEVGSHDKRENVSIVNELHT